MPPKRTLTTADEAAITLTFKASHAFHDLLGLVVAHRSDELTAMAGQPVPLSTGAVLRWLVMREAAARGLVAPVVAQSAAPAPSSPVVAVTPPAPSAVAPSPSPVVAPPPTLPRALVLAAVDKLADQQQLGGLCDVPSLVRSLAPASPAAVHGALLGLARENVLELRPESGVGLLSDSDAALCPKGMEGVVLSYVCRREVTRAAATPAPKAKPPAPPPVATPPAATIQRLLVAAVAKGRMVKEIAEASDVAAAALSRFKATGAGVGEEGRARLWTALQAKP